MIFDTDKHNRRSIRLPNYDYASKGYYFVTICTYLKENIFGDVRDGKMVLNEYGQIVVRFINEIPAHFPNAEIAKYVIMLNHIHMIVSIKNKIISVGAQHAVPNSENNKIGIYNIVTISDEAMRNKGTACCAPTENKKKFGVVESGSLPVIIRSFKSVVTKQINLSQNISNRTIWQRNYFEHIIRNDDEMNKIIEYIDYNPKIWYLDQENPHKIGEHDIYKIFEKK
jgi:putative transposase